MSARMVGTSSCAQNVKFKVDWSMNRNWSGTDQATNAVLVHLHVIGSGMQLYKCQTAMQCCQLVLLPPLFLIR